MNGAEKRKLDEAIDACRPGSDDLQCFFSDLERQVESAAEVQHLFDRSQAFDVAVSDTLRHDVEIPDGMADRILASLSTESSLTDASTAPDVPTAIRRQMPARRRGRSRRRWVFRGVAIVAASALVWSLCLLRQPALTTDQIVQWAPSWPSRVVDTRTAWQPIPPHEPDVPGFPVPLSITVAPNFWQNIETQLAARTVVYDVSRTQRAFLFVAHPRRDFRNLPTFMPNSPQHASGFWSVATWRDGEHAYVLTFKGPSSRYRELVRGSAGFAQSDRAVPQIP